MRILLFVLLALITSCATPGQVAHVRPHKLSHVYIEPVTNRTTEEGLDVVFSRVANDVFYSDPRFKVDRVPKPAVTIVVKPTVSSISTFAVGFDRYDRVTEYKMEITAHIKLIRYGFTKPIATFAITRYEFYDTHGTASEIEQKRKECIEKIARQIFREVGERIFVEGEKIESSKTAGGR
jgi:hypothetical protein